MNKRKRRIERSIARFRVGEPKFLRFLMDILDLVELNSTVLIGDVGAKK